MHHPLIKAASAKSVWRGLDYYREKRVLTCVAEEGNWFSGTVRGSGAEPYQVRISLDHPRKSTCDCPHAKDKLIVCKHKVALFFQAMPGAEEAFLRETELEAAFFNLRLEKEREERHREIVQYVHSLTKAQLQEQLIEALEELDEREDEWW